MAQNDSTLSLDEWKEYFCHANADIFEVIKGAILVAASECPNEFKSRRGEIIEILYMGHPSKYRAEAETMNRAVDDRESTTVRAKDIKGTDSANVEPASCDESRTQPAQDKLNNSESTSLDKSKIVGEVVRIKRVLTNWKSKVCPIQDKNTQVTKAAEVAKTLCKNLQCKDQ